MTVVSCGTSTSRSIVRPVALAAPVLIRLAACRHVSTLVIGLFEFLARAAERGKAWDVGELNFVPAKKNPAVAGGAQISAPQHGFLSPVAVVAPGGVLDADRLRESR